MIGSVTSNALFRRFAPPVLATVLIGVFASLGFWQLDRAKQKIDLQALFDDGSAYLLLTGALPERQFQSIEARGRYVNDRQVLIENIIRDGRLGYFVITPFRQSSAAPLLLVNRGWLPRTHQDDPQKQIHVGDDVRVLRGKSGRLPRVSVRPGGAFDGAGDWPKNATYPTLDDVAAQLDADLLPFVLLLDADAPDGFQRQWQPQGSGPNTNYGYAFQWFSMALAVMAILVWQLRKQRRAKDSNN